MMNRMWLLLLPFTVLSGLAADFTPVAVSSSSRGTTQVSLHAKRGYHYFLYRTRDLRSLGEPIDAVLGADAEVVLRDRYRPLSPQAFYRVKEVANQASGDFDRDRVADADELIPSVANEGRLSGSVWVPSLDVERSDGVTTLTYEDFEALSVKFDSATGVGAGITGERILKFLVFPSLEPSPTIVFMNTHRHPGHASMLEVLDKSNVPAHHGELAWMPEAGENGLYAFNLQAWNAPQVEQIGLLYDLLTKHMTFIDGDLVYRPLDVGGLLYQRERAAYDAAAIPVLGASEHANQDEFALLNEGDSYGLLRVFDADERPSILDIAIYRQLPNNVPLVQGIITESPQTSLSHVNLRAVQNNNPNVYIPNASTHADIAPLVGKYVRYTVSGGGYKITEVSREEVDEHLAALRPSELQEPKRDLFVRNIRPLERFRFVHSSSIGVKAANLAEMIQKHALLGIPKDVFPENGHAVPFWFYHQFMLHNGFYEEAKAMIVGETFTDDPLVRQNELKAFRRRIKDGEMPEWMTDALTELQQSFPDGQGIRCRSSTNNEDLPGFNGAGLYESYTHHPDEGHLSRSVKQVFASAWTSLAFEHREFYRVDHFKVAMGVLIHPNYEDEQVNGVVVAKYPFIELVYQFFPARFFSDRMHYCNAQVGEDLVTNPEFNSVPEEILYHTGISRLIRLGNSNRLPFGEKVLDDPSIKTIGTYLSAIDDHFRGLYECNCDFAIELEFKITKDGNLAIKQARPWVD